MWRLGFFFHEMVFGLLSVFLPLYVIVIGGSLVDIGVMSAAGLFLAIPSSFFWGYICDKTGHYKRYILLSFLSLTVILYLFTFSTSVELLILLYALMAVFRVANEPPKNVLIAESYTRWEWERVFAHYEGLTEIGGLTGLLLGFLTSAYGFSSTSTLLMCSLLEIVAFAVSLILVVDPPIIFERSLVRIEKSVDFAHEGISFAFKVSDGIPTFGRLRRENLKAFCGGLILFSLATGILFTPLPIFFSEELGLSASLVFASFVLSSGGAVVGYLFAGRRLEQSSEEPYLGKVVIFRSVLIFLLIAITQLQAYTMVMAMTVLTLMGSTYALFLTQTLSISMEIIPQGKAGLFNVMLGIGEAGGAFVGTYLAQTFGFNYVFLITSVTLILAYIAFKIFA